MLELAGPDSLERVALPSLARQGSAVGTGVLLKTWTLEGFSPLLIPPTRRLTRYTFMDEDYENAGRVFQEWLGKIRAGDLKQEVYLDTDLIEASCLSVGSFIDGGGKGSKGVGLCRFNI